MIDKLEEIYARQKALFDKVCDKQEITDNEGSILTSDYIFEEATQGKLECGDCEWEPALGPNNLPNTWLIKSLDALDDESRELRAELLWKWWSKDKLDIQNIRVEIIDMLHFWMQLCIFSGMTPKDIHRIYMQKHQVNKDRQDQGYSKATKTEDDNKDIK